MDRAVHERDVDAAGVIARRTHAAVSLLAAERIVVIRVDRRRIGRGQWRARERLHLADHHLGSGI